MDPAPQPADVAAALRLSVGLFLRRLREKPTPGGLTLSESAALARLERGGPATSAALAKLEGISPQSMGATVAALESRGLIARSPDPDDGRRIVLSVAAAGRRLLRSKRDTRVRHLARALADDFTADELRELMAASALLERVAEQI